MGKCQKVGYRWSWQHWGFQVWDQDCALVFVNIILYCFSWIKKKDFAFYRWFYMWVAWFGIFYGILILFWKPFLPIKWDFIRWCYIYVCILNGGIMLVLFELCIWVRKVETYLHTNGTETKESEDLSFHFWNNEDHLK